MDRLGLALASPAVFDTNQMRLSNERFTAPLDIPGRRSLTAGWSIVAVIGALFLIFQLDRAAAEAPFQHLYYLPIILAAVRISGRAGLLVGTVAIVLYHLAKPVPFAWPQTESDFVQMALFIAVAIVTARLADDARRLRELAATDDLTGLHNLRSFEPRFIGIVRACRIAGVALALLVLDLDRLKSLNDTHGHLAGGEAVRAVGHVLAARLPASAVACRFGGDEFVVVIPDCSTVRAEAVARDIRQAVKALTPDLAGRRFPAGTLSVSVGAACLSFAASDAPGSSPAIDVELGEALFGAADRGLYAAKEQGRDRVIMVILSTASPEQWT